MIIFSFFYSSTLKIKAGLIANDVERDSKNQSIFHQYILGFCGGDHEEPHGGTWRWDTHDHHDPPFYFSPAHLKNHPSHCAIPSQNGSNPTSQSRLLPPPPSSSLPLLQTTSPHPPLPPPPCPSLFLGFRRHHHASLSSPFPQALLHLPVSLSLSFCYLFSVWLLTKCENKIK